MRTRLGIDVGATKIAAAIVDTSTGAILRRSTVASQPDRGGAEVLSSSVRLAEHILAGERADSIGIGVCELVAPDGSVTSAYSFDWRGVDIADAFSRLAPTVVESDVRAAAAAECAFGAGQGKRTVFYVNAGSGISSCLVIDGAPFVGARGNAILVGAGPLDVEPIAGGTGIAALAGAESAEAVASAADQGDRAAAELIEQGGRALGEASAFAVNLLDPELVVLGGGVGLANERYRRAFEAALRRHVWAADTRELPIVLAALGADAGVIGAALAGERVDAEALV